MEENSEPVQKFATIIQFFWNKFLYDADLKNQKEVRMNVKYVVYVIYSTYIDYSLYIYAVWFILYICIHLFVSWRTNLDPFGQTSRLVEIGLEFFVAYSGLLGVIALSGHRVVLEGLPNGECLGMFFP